MGLLTVGTPLSWDETKKYSKIVQKQGLIQFINLYRRLKDRKRDTLKWGDEIEYTLVYLDHKKKTSRLLLKCGEILPEIQKDELLNPGKNENAWRMEYADYMIEGTPGQPFGGCLTEFNRLEDSMKSRRTELMKHLDGINESFVCFAAFPRIGCPRFTEPVQEASPKLNPASNSLYYPDRAIYPKHPRFKVVLLPDLEHGSSLRLLAESELKILSQTLTKNIRSRRGRRPIINLPVFHDEKTPKPFYPDIPNDDGEAKLAIKQDHVYMDSMGFGMGCSCLQVTFQACNIDEARVLYDQLANMAPIMMALSAASPAFQGTLVDVDCRWNVISGAVDDRTPEELGEKPLEYDKYRIRKSRYDCIDMYISPCSKCYNDIPVTFDPEHKKMLLDAGIDDVLAEHIAHLFIRDSVSLFAEKLHLDNEVDTDHFENIQSTNWQSMRFKPPPPGSDIGWRVEFRPMEVQMTDFENAAYVVFIVLLTRVILSYKLNLLVPISKVEKNMETAVKRNAVLGEEFYFRKDPTCCSNSKEDPCELMSVDTIINGKENGFPGLISMMKSYLDSIDVDVDTMCTISQYLTFISRKASGRYKTTASWMRDFIQSHGDYKHDSHVSEKILYDLTVKCDRVARGTETAPELRGNPKTKSVNVSHPNCLKVGEEVERLKEKILIVENEALKKKKADTAINSDDFESRLGKSLGVKNNPGGVPF